MSCFMVETVFETKKSAQENESETVWIFLSPLSCRSLSPLLQQHFQSPCEDFLTCGAKLEVFVGITLRLRRAFGVKLMLSPRLSCAVTGSVGLAIPRSIIRMYLQLMPLSRC